MARGLNKLGWHWWPSESAINSREHEGRPACINLGPCTSGCTQGARASTDTEGMIKVLAHKETDEILGVHMVGPRTADIIAEAVALMEFRASAEDAARMSHAHPTYTEAFREAALAATDDRAIHI